MIQMAIATVCAVSVAATFVSAQADRIVNSNESLTCTFASGKDCEFDGIKIDHVSYRAQVEKFRKSLQS